MKLQENQIINTEINNYRDCAQWCNDNGYYLEKIDKTQFKVRKRESVLLSDKESAQQEMDILKQRLSDMDYKTSKYVDGDYSEQQWQEIVAERKEIRKNIRKLEQILENMA